MCVFEGVGSLKGTGVCGRQEERYDKCIGADGSWEKSGLGEYF